MIANSYISNSDMKKLSWKLFIVGLPFLIFLGTVEWVNRSNSVFKIKKDYLSANLSQTEVLILGSSHNQNGINPEFLKRPAANLAFGGQPLSIDYFLLLKYIESMPSLKRVIVEISPHNFYEDLNVENWNGRIYRIIHGIKYKNEEHSIKNYSLVLSNIRYFTSAAYDHFNPYSYKYQLNEYGFVTNDFKDRFELLQYNTETIHKTFSMSHTFKNAENFKKNADFLRKIVEICAKNKIWLDLVTPPFYDTYSSNIPDNVRQDIKRLIANIRKEGHSMRYYDFSCDRRFNVRDFKNDDHLNSRGASKFTQILNKELVVLNN